MSDGAQGQRPLPDGWRWVRLGDHVTKVGSGITPLGGEAVYVQSGIPLIRSQNVHPNRFVLDGLAYITAAQDAEMEGSRVCPGDVLLNITGASIGRVCVVPADICPANVNQHVSIVRCMPDLYPPFLSYYISTPEFQRFIMDTQAGATRQALTKTLIEDFQIPLPPLPEQQRIAAILNEQMAAVERARAAAEERLEAAKTLPAAYFRVVFKSSVARHWAMTRMADLILETRNGIYKPDEFYGSGVPILKMFNIGRLDGSWQLDRVDRIQLTSDEADIYRLKVGDILFNRVNSRELVGKCALVNDHTAGAVFESKNMRVRLNTATIDPAYAIIFLNSEDGRKQIEGKLKQIVGQATLNRTDLDDLRIPLPTLIEQQRIGAFLTDQMATVERISMALEGELKMIHTLPAALLRRAFSGEI